jgi:hypothetical protein
MCHSAPVLLPSLQNPSLFARTSTEVVFHISDSTTISITWDMPHENISEGISSLSNPLSMSHIHLRILRGLMSFVSRCCCVSGTFLKRLKCDCHHAFIILFLFSGSCSKSRSK